MSDDFRKLIEDIESEAKAESPAAEAELRELRREFSIASQLMTLRHCLQSQMRWSEVLGQGGSGNP